MRGKSITLLFKFKRLFINVDFFSTFLEVRRKKIGIRLCAGIIWRKSQFSMFFNNKLA